MTHSLIGWGIATVLFSLFVALIGLGYKYLIQPYNMGFLPFESFWVKTIDLSLMKRWISAFSIGYLSHIILDMFNPRGSQLFWPSRHRDVIFGSKFRPESGSKSEIIVFILLVVLMIFSFPLSKFGISTSLRWFLATPEAAIEEFKSLHVKAFLDFDGIFSESREPVSGKAEILDVQNQKLIIFFNGNVFTLSDQLAADITAQRVRVEKTDTPLVLDHTTFSERSREFLLERVPTESLVSGVIYLPQDLKLKSISMNQNNDTTGEARFKSIEQVGDQLRLTFATRSQLQAMAWDESFELMKKQDQIQLQKLNADIRALQSRIRKLGATEGLTPLGEQILLSPEEKDAKAEKQDALNVQIEQKNVAIEELKLKMKQHEFVFSGTVTIRHCMQQMSTAYSR